MHYTGYFHKHGYGASAKIRPLAMQIELNSDPFGQHTPKGQWIYPSGAETGISIMPG